jgi:DNA-binding MarR family transcriptional regulator
MTTRRSKQGYYRAWFKTLADFVDDGVRSLTRSELAVYLILMRDTKPDGTARAALTDLATRGGMTKDSAARAVRSLVKRGVLQVVRPGVSRKPTLYTVFPAAVFKTLNPTAARRLEGDEVGS